MSWPLSDDIEAVCNRLTPPMLPAKHWWAVIAQVVVVGGIVLALVAYAHRPPKHIPVHKTGPDRVTTTAVAR